MLDVRRMRVLREVAVRGSMSAAADALSYTPSAVSQQIAALEREAGVALVERGPRSVTLTDAGRALVEHTEVILERLEAAETDIRAIAGLDGGRLRLATFRSAAETLVADAVTAFHRRFPGVEITLFEGEPEAYLPRLKAGEFDLALSFDYDYVGPEPDSALEYRLLLEEQMLLILPQDHPAAAGPAVEVAELADEHWVGSPPGTSTAEFTPRACRAAGFEAKVAFESLDYHVCQALVASGVGVAFLPEMAIRTKHPHVEARPVRSAPPYRRIFAACRPDGERLPTIRAMISMLEELSGQRVPRPAPSSALSAEPR